eukprot:gene7780-biopygen11432
MNFALKHYRRRFHALPQALVVPAVEVHRRRVEEAEAKEGEQDLRAPIAAVDEIAVEQISPCFEYLPPPNAGAVHTQLRIPIPVADRNVADRCRACGVLGGIRILFPGGRGRELQTAPP